MLGDDQLPMLNHWQEEEGKTVIGGGEEEEKEEEQEENRAEKAKENEIDGEDSVCQ